MHMTWDKVPEQIACLARTGLGQKHKATRGRLAVSSATSTAKLFDDGIELGLPYAGATSNGQDFRSVSKPAEHGAWTEAHIIATDAPPHFTASVHQCVEGHNRCEEMWIIHRCDVIRD